MADRCRVVAVEHLTLDGVYQAPARADEDERGGFAHGGWSVTGDDPAMQKAIASYMGAGWSLLVGKTTYEDLYEGWQVRQPSSPMTKALTGVQKFVASHDPSYQLRWTNSTLLSGDAMEAVARLKREHDKTLIVFGSGVLVCSLMRRRLLDEVLMMVHPLVLGEGRRFFSDAPFASFALTSNSATASGVSVCTYELTPN
ncbi:MAG TPA: dihydrofolate reductase family protein [Polyangia bacterium]